MVVKNNPDIHLLLLQTTFSMNAHYTPTTAAASAEKTPQSPRTTQPEINVLNHAPPGQLTSLDTTPRLNKLDPQTKIIMFSAHTDLKTRTEHEPAINTFMPKTESTQPLAQQLTSPGTPPKQYPQLLAHLNGFHRHRTTACLPKRSRPFRLDRQRSDISGRSTGPRRHMGPLTTAAFIVP